MDSETIEVAALGRPLYPGMLYDCRKHSFIPGVTLWDKKSLMDDLDIRSQPQTDLKFSSSDSISDKCSLLDVSASLQASFMSGLVKVEGSAKYLRDTKSSNQQSRVTMHYRETTKFEQLTMTQLSHFTYHQLFEQKTATHVVTAVLYGANAFLVFDRTFSDDETKQDIEGELDVMVKSFPGFSIGGKGDVKMTDEEKKKAEKISCTFHGDFHLEQNPTTYIEALQVYQQLPTLLNKNNGIGVPLKIWLYPLSLLDKQAARLVREISTSLVSNTKAVMESLEEAKRRSNDLIRKAQINVFSNIDERVRTFQSSLSIYTLALQKELCNVLPDIQGGGKPEESLEDILKIYNESPFNASSLNQWLDNPKSELDLLSSYTKSLKGIRTEDSEGLKTILLNPDIEVVVCLNFTSLKYEDPYLSNLNVFLKSKQFNELDGKINLPLQTKPSDTKWFEDSDTIVKMRENLSHFRSFSEANKDDKRMCFIISAIFDSSNPGSSIYLYEKGKLTDKQFQPLVCKPPAPKVIIQGNTVSINMSKSPAGKIEQYRVEYKEEKPEKKEEWVVKNTTDENFTLTGLEYGKEYLVRYRIVGKVGVSEASDTACLSLADSALPVIVGGSGGDPFSFISNNENTVKRITISYATDTFNTMKVTFINGQMALGTPKANIEEAIIFEEDDEITKATVWPNAEKNKVAGLEFEVKKSDGKPATYSIKCEQLGEPVNIDVKSGRFYGITGRSAEQIDALGLYFI
nr:neoverrucotoxin subunit alpha-like [Misgurnus anguillicaudatus]